MKTQSLKNIFLFFFTILIFILHIPFVFAGSPAFKEVKRSIGETMYQLPGDSMPPATNIKIKNTTATLYDSMNLDLLGLSKQAFDHAIKGFNYLITTGKLTNDKIISIVDFSLPSSDKRLFVIDLDKHKVIFRTYVAHGINSGKLSANRFSNKPESNQSSLGFYETLNTYNGCNGYSLRLEGLEKGINDNAARRDIVIHGAAYVSEGLIKSQGYIGRSLGCPALPEKWHKPIIDKIKNGTCLFIYSPDNVYLGMSKIINAAG